MIHSGLVPQHMSLELDSAHSQKENACGTTDLLYHSSLQILWLVCQSPVVIRQVKIPPAMQKSNMFIQVAIYHRIPQCSISISKFCLKTYQGNLACCADYNQDFFLPHVVGISMVFPTVSPQKKMSDLCFGLVCLLPFEVQETIMHTSASTKMNHMGE